MPRHLFIVSRDSAHLAGHLREQFKHEAEVEVVLDRRQGQRRQRAAGAPAERRESDRRARPHVDKLLRATSYAFVTLR